MTNPRQSEFDAWAREYAKRMGLQFERHDPSKLRFPCHYCVDGHAAGFVIWREMMIKNPICVPCQNKLVDKLRRRPSEYDGMVQDEPN